MVRHCVELFAKVSCIGLLMFQGILLNLYLVKFYGKTYWAWQITDAIMIMIWCLSLYWAYRSFKLKKQKRDSTDGKRPEEMPDEIKYAFIPWLALALFLSIKVGLLFYKKAAQLKEEDVLGPNFLKIAVSCTPLIFLALVYGHHNSKPNSKRKYYIASITGSVCLDLFDSIDLLEFLFTPDQILPFPQSYLDVTLGLAIINFFLPTFALMELRVNSFAGEVPSLPFKALYAASNIFLVNVPNLVIRSLLWHIYNVDVSVLIMKNIMCIILSLSEVVEYFGEDQPIKCNACGQWFESVQFVKHAKKCRTTERTQLHVHEEGL